MTINVVELRVHTKDVDINLSSQRDKLYVPINI